MDISILTNLVRSGKIHEANDKINILDKNSFALEEQMIIDNLKCKINLELGNIEQGIKQAQQVAMLCRKHGFLLEQVDALISESEGNRLFAKYDTSMELIEDAENILSSICVEKHWWEKLLHKKLIRKLSLNHRSEYKTVNYKEFSERYSDISIIKALNYNATQNSLKAVELINQNIALNKETGHQKGLADSYSIMGYIFRNIGKLEEAIEYNIKASMIREELDNPIYIAHSLNNMGTIHFFLGELNDAMVYLNQSLEIREIIGNPQNIATTLNTIGFVYSGMYELEKAHDYLLRSLGIREAVGNIPDIAQSYQGIGINHFMIGKFSDAIEYYEMGLALFEENTYNKATIRLIYFLIKSAVAMNDLSKATEYDNKLKIACDEHHIDSVTNFKKFSEALILKNNKRAVDKAKAQELFQELVEDEKIDYYMITIDAMLNLCELLLEELKNYGEEEVLIQLKDLIDKLIEITTFKNVYSISVEAYVLKSHISLIELDFMGAKKLLNKAQKIAEVKGIGILAKKISREHDRLLDSMLNWEEAVNSDISKRIELSQFESLIAQMIQNKTESLTEDKLEDPVLLMIINEAGRTIYSKQFSESKPINKQLIGAFLSAINSFSQEVFSTEGYIERIKYNEYTLIFMPKDSILLCYAFKGESYHALQKLENFIQELESESQLWETINDPFSGITENHKMQISVKLENSFFLKMTA